MSDLIDYLHVDYDLAGLDREDTEARLRIKIGEVPFNRFHYPIPGEKGVRHFRLDLYAETRYMDAEDGEPEEWHQPNCSLSGAEVATDSVLPFYMSTHGEPTPEKFSKHIYTECYAALFAVHHPQTHWDRFSLRTPKMEDLFVYMKLHHKDYERSRDFLRDYNYWEDRLWQTQKWFHYLLGDLPNRTSFSRFRYSVGENLLGWIGPDNYPPYIDETRESFKQRKD
jgi:hypothetical protein